MSLLPFVLILGLSGQSPVEQPPRDPRPVDLDRARARAVDDEHERAEQALRRAIAESPDELQARLALSKFEEESGDYEAAVAVLSEAKTTFGNNAEFLTELAGLYNRMGDFENTMTALEDAERLEPQKREGAQRVAVFYWEKAFRDRRITDQQKRTYVDAGIAAADRALAIDRDYAEALTYKNILLRMQANMETDPALQQQLIARADELRARAIELNKARTLMPKQDGVNVSPPPPPPPPDGPVRVGGGVRAPTKIADARPVYPPDALAARVQGVVIIEATIDTSGAVGDMKVLRSVPLLDEAALEAVGQWRFTPTYLNGQPVSVIMTVTVNFTLPGK
jgi:protein TonB